MNAVEKSKWDSIVEVGADGKLRLKKSFIDLKDLDDDTLRKLGIDPTLSKKDIARKLKVLVYSPSFLFQNKISYIIYYLRMQYCVLMSVNHFYVSFTISCKFPYKLTHIGEVYRFAVFSVKTTDRERILVFSY